MRAPLSIVIPTLNAERELPETLAHLTEGLSAGLIRELIISDGGSTDGTKRVAEAAGAIWLVGEAGRGGQLRLGADHAGGAWLLFLHADTHLQQGWSGAVIAAMKRDQAAYFWLRFRARGVFPALVARWANLRSRLFQLPYGDQALLVSRRAYDAAGGYDPIPLMEDVALIRRLRPVRAMDGIAATGADRYIASGWIRRGARNLWTLARYFAGVSPETLAQSYRRR